MSGFAVTNYNPAAVGMLSARLGSLQSSLEDSNANITLGVNSDRYQKFLVPSQNIDGFALADMNTINSKKDEIVDLGDGDTFYGAQVVFATSAAAEAEVNTIYGADILTSVGVATALRFPSSSSFTDGQNVTQQNTGAFGTIIVTANSQRALLTGVGGPGSFNTTDNCAVGIGTTQYDPTDTQIGVPNQVQFAGIGNINNDLITIQRYPNLEPVDTSASNPYAGEVTQNLGTGNTGLGIANTYFSNGGSFIGRVFAFDTTADVAAAASITNISNEIVGASGLRPGITSFTDTVNIIKPYKNSFALNVWSLSRVNANNQNEMVALSTAISILNDPQYGGPY